MRRLALGMLVAAAACTDPGTDPNAVVAIRFDGSAYPSIVVGDSLRDSLGALQPIRAVGLNYKGNEVAGADIVFSSPDTNLRVFNTGTVFAKSRKVDGSPTRLFATVGSLQSRPDSLFTAVRVDSIRAMADADTVFGFSNSQEDLAFTLFGDTATGKPKVAVQGWLVSFRLRYHGVALAPTDTNAAFSCIVTTRRIRSIVDTTDASGSAGRRVCLKTPRRPADTVFVTATAQRRKAGTVPLTAEIRVLFLPDTTGATRGSAP